MGFAGRAGDGAAGVKATMTPEQTAIQAACHGTGSSTRGARGSPGLVTDPAACLDVSVARLLE